jgi:acyl-coenzyme A thioesterase PaaI-like protein
MTSSFGGADIDLALGSELVRRYGAGCARDAYARATINRSGRRYASVHVEAWQDNRTRMFAQATGHFLMPQDDG